MSVKVIPADYPRVEWSKDGGKTWDVWVYYRPGQEIEARAAYGRMCSLYADTDWQFRVKGIEQAS